MKYLRILVLFISFLGLSQYAQAQIFEKVKEAAKETAEDEAVEETKKTTKETIKGIFGKKKKKKQKENKKSKEKDSSQQSKDSINKNEDGENSEIVTGSHFFPDGDVLFFENFDKDKKGDFPINWQTNLGGEIISFNDTKALYIYSDSQVLLDVDPLPENCVVELDLITHDLQGHGNSLFIQFISEKKFYKKLDQTSSGASVELPVSGVKKLRNTRIKVKNWGEDVLKVENVKTLNFNQFLERETHITIVKNKNRFRLYLDNQKVLDLPSFLGDETGNYLRIIRDNLRDNESVVAIKDIKITEESKDIRSKLLKGNLTTNKILFDTGSSTIQAQSQDILQKIGDVLAEKTDMQFLIIGHTDSDGKKEDNQTLSKERAQAVVDYLVKHHNLQAGRLIPVGKGESEPIASNDNEEGKKQNRRVQFKKL